MNRLFWMIYEMFGWVWKQERKRFTPLKEKWAHLGWAKPCTQPGHSFFSLLFCSSIYSLPLSASSRLSICPPFCLSVLPSHLILLYFPFSVCCFLLTVQLTLSFFCSHYILVGTEEMVHGNYHLLYPPPTRWIGFWLWRHARARTRTLWVACALKTFFFQCCCWSCCWNRQMKRRKLFSSSFCFVIKSVGETPTFNRWLKRGTQQDSILKSVSLLSLMDLN